MQRDPSYAEKARAEARKWGDHLAVEARGEMLAWLDHPKVAEHYHRRALIDGLSWPAWVSRHFGGPAERSLDLGCGAGARSLALWRAGGSRWLDGVDLSAERIAEGERRRIEAGAPGSFVAADVNALELEPQRYDLIFSAHSFHHFLELEHLMEQVAKSLTPRGLFLLEEYVGPTQFQWTDRQMALTDALLQLLPARLRRLPWGATKEREGRPTPEEVMAVSPFESIRSAEIVPLFDHCFERVVVRDLGGTVQHLLYNGIAGNFWPLDEESAAAMEAIVATEDHLLDSGLLPSDFMLLVGRPR